MLMICEGHFALWFSLQWVSSQPNEINNKSVIWCKCDQGCVSWGVT